EPSIDSLDAGAIQPAAKHDGRDAAFQFLNIHFHDRFSREGQCGHLTSMFADWRWPCEGSRRACPEAIISFPLLRYLARGGHCGWVLDLAPLAGAAGEMAGSPTLRHHPLGADLAGVLIEYGAVDRGAVAAMD